MWRVILPAAAAFFAVAPAAAQVSEAPFDAAPDSAPQIAQLRERIEGVHARLRAAPNYPAIGRAEIRILGCNGFTAFAAPDGWIGVCSGLINTAATDDELAFVLAHEIGHLGLDHSRIEIRRFDLQRVGRQISGLGRSGAIALAAPPIIALYVKAFEDDDEETHSTTQNVMNAIAAAFPSPEGENLIYYLAPLAASAVAWGLGEVGEVTVTQTANAAFRARRPEQELEADSFAVELMAEAGYNPDGALFVLNALDNRMLQFALAQRSELTDGLARRGFSDNPDFDGRTRHVRRAVTRAGDAASPIEATIPLSAHDARAADLAIEHARRAIAASDPIGDCAQATANALSLLDSEYAGRFVVTASVAVACTDEALWSASFARAAGGASWYDLRGLGILSLVVGGSGEFLSRAADGDGLSLIQYADLMRLAVWGERGPLADDIAERCEQRVSGDQCRYLRLNIDREHRAFYPVARRVMPLSTESRAFLLQQAPEASNLTFGLLSEDSDQFWRSVYGFGWDDTRPSAPAALFRGSGAYLVPIYDRLGER